MKATSRDYDAITRDTQHLTARMRAFIMAQYPPATVVGKRICVTLPLEWISEELKKGKR